MTAEPPRESKEMAAYDSLPPELRRAIDECPWGTSAHFCEVMIRFGRLTADEATATIRGLRSWEDARDWNYRQQRIVWGRVLRQYG